MKNFQPLFPTELNRPKSNLTSASAPTINDDASEGYSNLSPWYNSLTGKFYILLDNTIGSANWLALTGSGNTSNKGYFIDYAALIAEYPTGQAGWYAILGSTDTIWIWDGDTTTWVNSSISSSVASIFGRTGTVTAQSGDYTAAQVTNVAAGNIVATTVQTAINELDGQDTTIAGNLSTHEADLANPHSVTATQVGLGNVDNTSDADKPVSNDTQAALNLKQDILLEGAFVDGDKTKLDGIEPLADVTDNANVLSAIGYTPEDAANKDASGGYVGLTLFKINFKNALNTFTSFFTNSNTAARTYTFQDRDGTIADDTDLANIALDDLTDVILTAPTVDEYLGHNGAEWVNKTIPTASAGSGFGYFCASPTITAAGTNNDNVINTLSRVPVTTGNLTVSKTANTNTVLMGAWVDSAIGRTTISGGTWTFGAHVGVSSIVGGRVSTLLTAIYKASDDSLITGTTTGTGTSRTFTATVGTPFVAGDANATNTIASYVQTPQGLYQITGYTSDTVVTIATPTTYVNETTVATSKWTKLFQDISDSITSITPAFQDTIYSSSQTAFAVLETDRLARIDFFTSNNTTTGTINYNSNETSAYVNTPIATLHNDLFGLQGGAANEYYHLTSAEYAIMQNTSGINTGDETVTTIGSLINGATAKSTPADADMFGLMDSAAGNVLKKLSWANVKATLKTYFDTFYVASSAVINQALTGYTKGAGTIAATDTILEAIQKIDGNDDAKAPLASPTFTGDVKGISVPFSFALSDETTAIITETSKITFRVPYACTLTDVRASLSTASSSGIPTFDINKNGTTVLSTKLTIDASEKTSITAANAAVISVSSFADDDEVTVDIDVSGTDATGAKVTLYLTRV